MNTFEFLAPRTLDEALGILAERGDEVKVLAGGTGLINMMKQRLVNPEALVSLGKIHGLETCDVTTNELRMGTLFTQQEAATSARVAEACPLLSETYSQVATPRVRNMATVGGSLVHGDPNQDPPVSLLALGAEVTLASKSGRRTLPLPDFLVDYYETATRPDEILLDILVPLPPQGSGYAYLKFLPRSADDYATVSAAAVVMLNEGKIEDVRLAVGSCAPTALRCLEAEKMLAGQAPTPELLRAAAETARAIADPVSDGRGSADYKKAMVPVFVRRALEKALERAEEGLQI